MALMNANDDHSAIVVRRVPPGGPELRDVNGDLYDAKVTHIRVLEAEEGETEIAILMKKRDGTLVHGRITAAELRAVMCVMERGSWERVS